MNLFNVCTNVVVVVKINRSSSSSSSSLIVPLYKAIVIPCADILSYILSGAPYYVTVWLNKETTSVVACTQIIRVSVYL